MRVGLHRLMLFMMMIPIISRADNILTVHDTTVIAGDTAWIHVSLDNDEDVVGFQFDLSFPSMLDYTGVADLSARGSGHSLEVNANGPYLRFMAYNLDLTPFSGNEGTLLTIGFETEQPYGDYAINLLDPVLGNDESDNILSGHSNGMLTLASPEPQLTAFAQMVIGEDSSFVISLDSLQAHVHDANTPVDELTWSLNADHLTITSSGNDHVVIPDENWFGRDTIIITVSDGIYQDDTVMPVRVLNVNDLPTLVSDIPDQSLSEDETLSLDLGNYFIDVDGQLNFGITDHDENCQVSLVDQILTMEPDTNWFGSGIISIYATDLLDTVGTSFNFVVDPVNDPVFSIMDLDPVVILEDSAASVILSGHFQDIDSELTFTASSDSLNLTTIVADTMLTLVPDQNWFGTTMIHVTAGDGQYESSLSFSMSVLAVNDPPIQTDSIFIHPMNEDSELMIILGPYFSDVDSDITYGAQSSVGQVSVSVSSDTLVIDPQADWHGQATISITYQDQEFTNLTDLELQVMPVNDPPTRSEVIADQSILEDSDLELDMDDHFIDIDSELFFTVDELDDIDLSFDGSELLVSPQSDWNGTRYVFVTASDLEYSITDTFLLTVNAVNDPPDPVTLSYPLDGSEVESLDVTLDWQEPFDVDSDVVYTTLYLQFNGGTMSYGLDTIGLTFNVVEMQMPYDDPITWWISVTDGLLYTTSDTHEFTVPSDIRFNGPLWTISKDGDDVISDGSSRYPFPRIQQGMSSANNGDTVLVTPGTFNETINFLGKNIVVSSRFMMDGDTSHIRQTIIDGGGTDRCVYFSNDEGNDALLHGMTIQNGYAYNGGGGGIHIQGASPRIQRCVIINNVAYSSGGGISVQNSSAQIENCTIAGNACDTSPNDGDGGLAIYTPASPTIKNCIIYGNNTNYQYVDRTGNASLSFSLISEAYPSDLVIDSTNLHDTDPLYNDPDNNDHGLQFASPCIDAGDPDNDGDGVDWLTDEDDWDPDGTRLDMGALPIEQNDSIPPVVSLIYPTDGVTVRTSEPVEIIWSAEDNRVLTWAKLYYATDGGTNYVFIDSLQADRSSHVWIPSPDALTTNAKIKILVSDRGGNIADVEMTGSFTIEDGTPPIVAILSPDGLTSVPEFEPIPVAWDAHDNDVLDSVFIDYSTNGGATFTSLTSISAELNEVNVDAPEGIVPFARIRLRVSDVNDNFSFTISDTFQVTDNTPPVVTLDTPELGSIGMPRSVSWDATDNGYVFSSHVLLFSPYPDSAFVLVDSISGSESSFTWIPDNFVTDSARLKIICTDMVGLYDMDTTAYFPIIDEIPPSIAMISPDSTTSILEYDSMTVRWNASDNIAMDSIWIYYSNVGNAFDLKGSVSQENDQFVFPIPFGVTDSARIRLVAEDVHGNVSEVVSDHFSIIDNTPPTVSINSPDGAALGDTLLLQWAANDNTTLRSHHLFYSDQSDMGFLLIDSISGEYSSLGWPVPNIVSDQFRVAIVTFDGMGLSSSDTSDAFSIYDVTPPNIDLITPSGDVSFMEYSDLSVSWSVSDNISVDSVEIYYSNDGGSAYELMGQVPDSTNEFVFAIPQGVTDSAQIRLVGSDIYGNEGEDISNYFSVTDNTPPTVSMESPGDVNIADSMTISWNADDNTGIDHQAVYFSSGLDQVFTLIDSIEAGQDSLQWTVPNLVTSDARLMVSVTDIVGMTDQDTTDIFSISDGIDPEISVMSVTGPIDGLPIKEYDTVTVAWDASDNIELDSALIWYSNNGGDEYLFVGATLATASSYDLEIPSGVTDHALIRVQVSDLAQNTATDTSSLFTVTDNTPPTVSIISPEVSDRFDIDGTMDIVWLANDNVSVTGLDLAYSVDQGLSWIDMDTGIPNSGNTQWVVVNEPTDDLHIRLMAHDSVGLSATSIVTDIAIDIVYPKVTNIFPIPGPMSWQTKQISIGFTQKMLAESLNGESIQFTSMYSDSVSPSFNYVDSIQTLYINLSTGFAGLDTVTVMLDGQNVRNHYGYALDGNNDGEGGDDLVYQYEIGMVADFNADGMISGIDLNAFVSSWSVDQHANELGPYTGTLPNVLVHPDGVFDIEDLMSFVLMGNWYLSGHGVMVSNTIINGPEIEHVVGKDSILIDLPEGTRAYDMQIIHGQDIILGEISKDEDEIVIMQKDKEGGVLNVIAEHGGKDPISLSYEIHSDKTVVQLYVQVYGEEGNVISNLMESIEIVSIPEDFTLYQNYPNPFNPSTRIRYGLPIRANVRLSIYDLLGREVVTLMNGIHDAGNGSIIWRGNDKHGNRVGAGMYFYVLDAGDFKEIRKMIYLK